MAGYVYGASAAKQKRAEEFSRRREAAEAAKKSKVKEGPIVTAEFEIVKEEPPTLSTGAGRLQVAAKAAVEAISGDVGEWYRVANRSSRSQASSFSERIRNRAGRGQAQTRIVKTDGGFLVFARIKTEEETEK